MSSAVWAVGTSLPQPVAAVTAFVGVASALPLLPVGLGFAAGAMVWVAVVELAVEASDVLGKGRAWSVVGASALAMAAAQHALR